MNSFHSTNKQIHLHHIDCMAYMASVECFKRTTAQTEFEVMA